MLNRYPVTLLTLAAVLLGYLASNTSVKAQNTSLPFVVGETITLRFASGSILDSVGDMRICSVADIRGTYVRCAAASRRPGAPEPPEVWFNMQSVGIVEIDR